LKHRSVSLNTVWESWFPHLGFDPYLDTVLVGVVQKEVNAPLARWSRARKDGLGGVGGVTLSLGIDVVPPRVVFRCSAGMR